MNAIRHLQASYLYNMLQDFRHLVIFDFRSDFLTNYIRDSFNVNESTTQQQINQLLLLAQQKATEKESKYKQLKRVRRFFFIFDTNQNEHPVNLVMKCINKLPSVENKIYALANGFHTFLEAYPFMCLSQAKLKQAKQSEDPQKFDRTLLYPYAKFPAEIIVGKLYLGNIYSSNSEVQLKDLKIKQMVDFIDYKENELVPEFKKNYGLNHLPFNTDIVTSIDFDVINDLIDQCIQKGPTLLYCRDGQTIAPAFVVSYLMYKTKLGLSMATLKVCQAISRVQICKWIYTQLLTYKPTH